MKKKIMKLAKHIVIRFSPIDNIDLAIYHSNLTTIVSWPLDFAKAQPYGFSSAKTPML
jgi:hypothetical protein